MAVPYVVNTAMAILTAHYFFNHVLLFQVLSSKQGRIFVNKFGRLLG